MSAIWVFGYGSLIWRPDFAFIDQRVANVSGYERRFWQGSHDHRGVPESPGRVVTLVPMRDGQCTGMAYLVDADVVSKTFEMLDHREKNGYDKHDVTLTFQDDQQVDGVVYIGSANNFAWLGDAPMSEMAEQIARSHGPSGANSEYLFELANVLRELNIQDDHVFELDAAVRAVQQRGR
jgi:cation transport regulator ChaC